LYDRILWCALLIPIGGCQVPCKDGFARANDGMCDAIMALDDGQEHTPQDPGLSEDTADPDPGILGEGSISIQATTFSGWQHHAYVLEAYPEDKHFAEAAMCVILLSDPQVITGQLVDWNPIYEPVCSIDSPDAQIHTFAPGPVTLRSFIYVGEGASPSACGEVSVTIDGDIEIPAPEVGGCE